MDFKEAMQHSLKIDKLTHTDPFLLHSRVCDLVGNDYEAKKAAEEFYRLDAKYEISKTILASVPVRYKKRKKHYYKIKPMPIPPDNAYVFYTNGSPTLHLSAECPCLKDKTIYRTTYDHARYIDFLRTRATLGHRYSYRLSKSHKPKLCRRCGSFTPTFARSLADKIRLFLWSTFGIGNPVHIMSYSYDEWNE